MFQEQFLQVGEHKLKFALGPPSGPPLLLLHGITRKWEDFAPALPYLLPRWQVIGLSFRGHGGSSFTPGNYLLQDYLEDGKAALRQLCSEPAVLFGHSLGAMAAVGLAARHPDRVRAIVLEDPPSHRLIPRIRETPFFPLFDGFQKLAGPGRSLAETTALLSQIELPQGPGKPPVRLGDLRDQTSIRFTARCLEDMDPAVLTPLLEGRLLEGTDWHADLARVQCPALLLYGETLRGGMLDPKEAEEAGKLMAEATVLPVRNVGHLLHWLALDETVRYVLGFLESLR